MSYLDRIQFQINKGLAVYATKKTDEFYSITVNLGLFQSWKSQTLYLLEDLLSEDNVYLRDFVSNVTSNSDISVESGISILTSLNEDYVKGYIKHKSLIKESNKEDPLKIINNLCKRFHLLARQLRQRHDNRTTLDVQDEYDVQDLFHSNLHLFFEDIRPEEWTPSYAGKSSRMDFLLKSEEIVIEIKKTRRGLTAKELGSQLIEDIERYKSHPNCKKLICFTYDPEGLIANPRGIENDLNRSEGDFSVHVYIHPA
jgi:hypothetical protein